MANILATGFTPFDGRDVNASWIAAQYLAQDPDVSAIEVPVVWGEPMRTLVPILAASDAGPTAIISLGEGRTGWFDIETRARNERSSRADNKQHLPNPVSIVSAGPHQLDATVNARKLQRALSNSGLPVRISTDAGAFLCEEMLYTLETLKQQHAYLQLVTFIHLPPFGTNVTVRGHSVPCDEALLGSFAVTLRLAVHEQLNTLKI